ncbi:MAG TPA: hypothetical protein VF186_05885 [Gaiellaceae bacterium]
MRRLVAAGLGLAGGLALHAAPALAAAPPIARPNPALVSPRLDYVGPVTGPSGEATTLAPLDQTVIAQALADQAALVYRGRGDLGGFVVAPIQDFVATTSGRAVVGVEQGPSEIPRLAQAGDGRVTSFANSGLDFGAPSGNPPDNGVLPVPGVGTPPATTPPGNTNTVPPPNQGFGGKPEPPGTTTRPSATTTTTGRGTGTTSTASPPPPTTAPTTTTRPRPPTTTTTPTTTTPTTTTPPPTTVPTTTAPTTTTVPTTTTSGSSNGGGSSGGSTVGGGASCGTTGLSITSDHATCRIYATNMSPGGSASEVMTVRNETDAPFTLSLKAAGSSNQLWDDLRMGVWQAGTAAPSPLPPLGYWTTQFNDLTTLAAGQTIRYEIELLLPADAGNADQGLVASIDLVWKASG